MNTHITANRPEIGARETWIDVLRVAACFMVMIVHSTEPFYLGGEGGRILTPSDAVWSSFFDSFVRACVPLFVVASSYLQFPLHYSTATFFRRRMQRVLVPFIIWSCTYALLWDNPIQNFHDLLFNFNYASGHLWFVYMLIGIYFLMPLLSPWAERVSKRELQFYLGIWGFTLLIPLIRAWSYEGVLPIIYGPSGLPNPALYPLWGEASWNAYGTFYYLSGFIGYLLLGLYLRRFVPSLSWQKTFAIGLPAWLAGFAICFFGFLRRVAASAGCTGLFSFLQGEGASAFPIEGPVNLAVVWETTWINDTIGVALMTIGWLLFFRKMNTLQSRLLERISRASYGMYLCHMFVLVVASSAICNWLGKGTEGLLGAGTTPLEILLTAMATFLCTALACIFIQRIPKVGKWIVG